MQQQADQSAVGAVCLSPRQDCPAPTAQPWVMHRPTKPWDIHSQLCRRPRLIAGSADSSAGRAVGDAFGCAVGPD